MQKGFIELPILAVLAVLALAGAYYVGTTAGKLPSINISLTPASPDASLGGPPLPPEVPSPSTDETANWKTYADKKYGYSFRYPAIWELEVSGSSVIEHTDTEGPTFPEFYVTVFSNLEQSPPYGSYNVDGLADLIVYSKKSYKIGDKIILEKPSSIEPKGIYFSRLDDITVGGKPAMVFEGNARLSTVQDRRVVVTHKGVTYMIGVYYVPKDGSTVIDNFDQILSTFRFD